MGRTVANDQDVIAAVIKAYGENSPRSLQSAAGILGASDIGFCRQKAVLMTRGVPQSDSSDISAAQMGIAIHDYLGEALAWGFPTWIVDRPSLRIGKVTARFPSGYEVSGTPDALDPDNNRVIDVKTKDGLEVVKRMGPSMSHRYQRHIYGMGAIDAGYLDPDWPMIVANLYIDRAGNDEPLLLEEEFDPTLTDEIDQWIGDVTYAVKTGEDASRDVPAPVCERICEFFTVCRGGALPDSVGGMPIEDDELLEAVLMYVQGRDMAKEGERLKKQANSLLRDINGIANVDGNRFQVRWTHVNSSTVEAYERAPYSRLDVRAVRG
jgi:hypothetical protein